MNLKEPTCSKIDYEQTFYFDIQRKEIPKRKAEYINVTEPPLKKIILNREVLFIDIMSTSILDNIFHFLLSLRHIDQYDETDHTFNADLIHFSMVNKRCKINFINFHYSNI